MIEALYKYQSGLIRQSSYLNTNMPVNKMAMASKKANANMPANKLIMANRKLGQQKKKH